MRLLWALLVVLVLVTAACSSQTDTGDETEGTEAATDEPTEETEEEATPETTPPEEAATADEPTATEEATTEAAEPEGEPVVLGHFAPLSGTAASNGTFESAGVNLAIEQANADGGVLGGEVQLVQYDDGGLPEQTTSVVRRMLDQDQVQAIVGGILSTNTLAVTEVIPEDTLFFVTAAKAPAITETGLPHLFRLDSTLVTDTSFMNEYLVANPEVFPCTRIYMVAEDTDYGNGDSGLYRGHWEEQGSPAIVALDAYPFQNTDFTTILTQIQGSDADCIYVNGNIGEMTAFLQQVASLGIELPIFAATSNISQPMVTDAGPAIEGIVSGDVYISTIDNPENEAFVEAYTEATGAEPERQAAMGYTVTQILLRAMDEAGSTDPAAVADVIRSNTWDTPFGPLSFDENGQSDMTPLAITVTDGMVVPLS